MITATFLKFLSENDRASLRSEVKQNNYKKFLPGTLNILEVLDLSLNIKQQ